MRDSTHAEQTGDTASCVAAAPECVSAAERDHNAIPVTEHTGPETSEHGISPDATVSADTATRDDAYPVFVDLKHNKKRIFAYDL